MTQVDTWQSNYNELKSMPWSIVQPLLAGLHLVLLFIPKTRPVISLLVECYQIVLLAIFRGLALEGVAMKAVLMLQFSHFKVMDVTFWRNSSKTWLGYYTQLMDNAYPLIVLTVILLLTISFSACFGLKALKNYLSRFFYRTLILGFLPMTLYFTLAIRAGIKYGGEFYVSIGVYAIYIIITLFSVIRYMPRSKIASDWEYDNDPTNTLEFRVNLQHNGKSREYFNVAISPVFKLFLVVWTVMYPDKTGIVNMAIIGSVFFCMILYLSILRPFNSLGYNLYVILLYLLTGLMFISTLIGNQLGSIKEYGSYPIFILLGLMVLISIGASLLGIKKQKTAPKKHANEVLTTFNDSERSEIKVQGSAPINTQTKPVKNNLVVPIPSRGTKNQFSNKMLPSKQAGSNNQTINKTRQDLKPRTGEFTGFNGNKQNQKFIPTNGQNKNLAPDRIQNKNLAPIRGQNRNLGSSGLPSLQGRRLPSQNLALGRPRPAL